MRTPSNSSGSGYRETGPSVQPMPLVRISTRRHVPIDPMRTRLGIGNYFIDHAAGVREPEPLPPPAAETGPAEWPPSRDLARQGAGFEPASRSYWNADSAPVRLPMRTRWSILAPLIALAVIFVAVCISMLLTGGTATIPGGH